MAYTNQFKNILGESVREVPVKPQHRIIREEKEIESNELIEETPFKGNEEKLNEKDETQILLLNEVLKRLISLEEKIDTPNITPTINRQENNRKIVVNRDEQGKIIGAEIVEG